MDKGVSEKTGRSKTEDSEDRKDITRKRRGSGENEDSERADKKERLDVCVRELGKMKSSIANM
eukprot:9015075-Lingulodinium_polyedra.AAC.1